MISGKAIHRVLAKYQLDVEKMMNRTYDSFQRRLVRAHIDSCDDTGRSCRNIRSLFDPKKFKVLDRRH